MTLPSSLRAVVSLFIASLCLCAHGETTVSWKPHPKAESYFYVIANDEFFSSEVLSDSTEDAETKGLKHLKPGTYYIKVKFIDRWGRESKFSPIRTFEVMIEENEQTPELPYAPVLQGIIIDLAYIPTLSFTYDGKDFSNKNFLHPSFSKHFSSSEYHFLGSLGGIMAPSHESKILFATVSISKQEATKELQLSLRSTLQYFSVTEKTSDESLNLSGANLSLGPALTYHGPFHLQLDSHLGIDKDFSKLTSLKLRIGKASFKYFTLSPGIGYTKTEALGDDGRLQIESLNFFITIEETNGTVPKQ